MDFTDDDVASSGLS